MGKVDLLLLQVKFLETFDKILLDGLRPLADAKAPLLNLYNHLY